eukprot:jgi/Bigna1/88646/estExt_fgenesh1_pg.C_350127
MGLDTSSLRTAIIASSEAVSGAYCLKELLSAGLLESKKCDPEAEAPNKQVVRRLIRYWVYLSLADTIHACYFQGWDAVVHHLVQFITTFSVHATGKFERPWIAMIAQQVIAPCFALGKVGRHYKIPSLQKISGLLVLACITLLRTPLNIRFVYIGFRVYLGKFLRKYGTNHRMTLLTLLNSCAPLALLFVDWFLWVPWAIKMVNKRQNRLMIKSSTY